MKHAPTAPIQDTFIDRSFLADAWEDAINEVAPTLPDKLANEEWVLDCFAKLTAMGLSPQEAKAAIGRELISLTLTHKLSSD
ncbi:MAG: hypothetical protein ACHQ50_10490 [Fimbriimonadales bacterium]